MYTQQEQDFDQQCQNIYQQKQLIQLLNDTHISSANAANLQSSFAQTISSIQFQHYSTFQNNFSSYSFGDGGAINVAKSPSLPAINANINTNSLGNLNQFNSLNLISENADKQTYRHLLLVRLFQKNNNIRKIVSQMNQKYQALRKGFENSLDKNDNPNTNTSSFQTNGNCEIKSTQQPYFSQFRQQKLVIKEVSKIRDREDINQVCNKLKVLISKVKSIQSSKLEYTFQSYAQKMTEYFQQFEKESLAAVEKQKKVCDLLVTIKKNYGIVNAKGLRYYKLHTSNYLLLNLQKKQNVQFFVNFYSQKLLFFQGQPIVTFPKDILYCPIVVSRTKQYVKISEWYLQILNEIDPFWQYFHIKICIFHKQTSCIQPIYTSYLKLSQINDKIQQAQQRKGSGTQNLLNLNKTSSNQNSGSQEALLKVLKMIRNYVYQKMVYQWLSYIFTVDGDIDPDCCKYSMDIADNFRVQIRKEKGIHKNGFEQQFKPQLFSSLMTFANQKSNSNKNKYQLKQRLKVLFQSSIFNLIAQKSEYRINFPTAYGSLGEFYFNCSKKSYTRHSVTRFLKQF